MWGVKSIKNTLKFPIIQNQIFALHVIAFLLCYCTDGIPTLSFLEMWMKKSVLENILFTYIQICASSLQSSLLCRGQSHFFLQRSKEKLCALKYHSIGTIICILCSISWYTQAQTPNSSMFFHHMLHSSCKGCNKCMWHLTDMIFESVSYTREKRKKQPMLFLYMKAIQIYLEPIRAVFVLISVSFLYKHFVEWWMSQCLASREEKKKDKPKFHV